MAAAVKPALSPRQFQLVARALSDPRRMALLESIGSAREFSCQKLCKDFPISKGTVSHHINQLARAGLIDVHKHRKFHFYEVRREVLAAYAAELMRRVSQVEVA